MNNNEIKFLHYRAIDESTITPSNPRGVLSRTGATVGYIEEEGKPIRYATAYCHPYDNYSKKLGRFKVTMHLENSSQRCEDTDLSDRNQFREAMDANMAEYGYYRLRRNG